MAPKAPEGVAPSLPSTTDFNTLYNRISLAAAKQNTFLNSMRAKYPSLKNSSAPTPAPIAETPSTTKVSGFSSLRPETATASPKPVSHNPFGKTKAQLRAEQEDAADPLRYDSPNSGLGYVPSKAETSADAATQDLSRRILGKRARELKGKANGADIRRRPVVEEESDDDEGRSGLGRRKRVRSQPQPDQVRETEEDAPVVSTTPEDEPVPAPEPETATETSTPQPASAETSAPEARASEAGEAKKRRKKKNKNIKKTQK